jgi:raffinose/stachyose/melibiose transport system permease protein
MTRKKRSTIVLEILTIILFISFLSPFVILIINASKESSFEVLTDPLALTGTFAQLLENIDEVWNSTNTRYQQH